MTVDSLLQRALKLDFLTIEEGVFLYENASTAYLVFVGNELRKKEARSYNYTLVEINSDI